LIGEVEDAVSATVILFLTYTGLRWGEMAALKLVSFECSAEGSLSMRRLQRSAAGSFGMRRNRTSVEACRSPPSSRRRSRPHGRQAARRPDVRGIQRCCAPGPAQSGRVCLPRPSHDVKRRTVTSRPSPTRPPPYRRFSRHQRWRQRQGRPDDARARVCRPDTRCVLRPGPGRPGCDRGETWRGCPRAGCGYAGL